MRRFVLAACGVVMMFGMPVTASQAGGPSESKPTLATLAQEAVSTDKQIAITAIQALRQAGPAGLAALRAAHADEIDIYVQSDGPPPELLDPRKWQRLRFALDAVSAQRDSAAAGLYWETDLTQAKARAQAENKPILALYMLGRLTDELSCANSRFFRSLLYPNEKISRMLSERFVLVWQSVRPVPIVTIDFGDGRKLLRTVTGNSVHYVLDAQGRAVDAIPGLYSPEAFLRALQNAEPVARQSAQLADNWELLRDYHQQRIAAIDAAYEADLAAIRRLTPQSTAVTTARPPLVLPLGSWDYHAPSRNPPPEDDVWQLIAARHLEDANIDPASVNFIKRKSPAAADAGALARTKNRVERPLVTMLEHLQSTVASDTVRNEYVLHRQIHQWLTRGSGKFAELNERVYAELFLTPSTDQWLGLVPDKVYSGLENDGLILSSPPSVSSASIARVGAR